MTTSDHPSLSRLRDVSARARQVVCGVTTFVTLAYVGGIVAWLVLRQFFPDSRWWWLALADTFALYLFTPLILLIPVAWLTRTRWAARAMIIPLVAFLWLFGGLFLPKFPTIQADAPTLTVMTFNVWGFNTDAEAIAGVIHQVNPDIILLQEVRGWTADELVKQLSSDYPYAVRPRFYSLAGTLGIFSRYPIVSSDWVTPPGVWRWGLHAVLDVDGQTVHVVNLHLTSSSGAATWKGLIRQVEITYPQREKEAQLFHEFIAGLNGPVIVGGDCNTTDQTTAYHMLTQGLRDAFRSAGWGLGHTYPSRPGRFRDIPIPARLVRIDYVFYSRGMTAIDARVGPSDGISDHLPMVATLQVRPH
ncbi:MAG: endonuclease/exonuclease/phosphatase family protein [Anaerolineae bacterium]|nr:endonuclease/exonuclease/phosphatase family protein [Anaerolineae bacterium]